MWKAKIIDKQVNEGAIHVTVAYRNDTKKFIKTYSPSNQTTLDAWITDELERLNNLDTISIQVGKTYGD